MEWILEWIEEERWIDIDDAKFTQRYVLAVLYYSTGGDNWEHCFRGDAVCKSNRLHYLSSDDECLWYGNSCRTDNGLIRNLIFTKNNLTGTIPTEISALLNLERLILVQNTLYGSIPHSLVLLRDLRVLYLYGNYLSGQLPESFYGLTEIKSVSLLGNSLTGTIATSFGKMLDLESLILGFNSFKGTIPSELGYLSKLTNINLSARGDGDMLNGTLPEEILAIKGMKEISLYGNQITGKVSKNLGALENLTKYDVSNNMMNGELPLEFFDARKLEVVLLDNNDFTGTISSKFDQLPFLKELGLGNNMFEGKIPLELSNLGNLGELSN